MKFKLLYGIYYCESKKNEYLLNSCSNNYCVGFLNLYIYLIISSILLMQQDE